MHTAGQAAISRALLSGAVHMIGCALLSEAHCACSSRHNRYLGGVQLLAVGSLRLSPMTGLTAKPVCKST